MLTILEPGSAICGCMTAACLKKKLDKLMGHYITSLYKEAFEVKELCSVMKRELLLKKIVVIGSINIFSGPAMTGIQDLLFLFISIEQIQPEFWSFGRLFCCCLSDEP